MQVEIYSKDNCSYCDMAKQVLRHYNVPFTEQKLGVNFTREILLEKFPSARTFPVVVIDGMYIGGYSQLAEELKSMFDNSRQLLNEAS